MCHAHVESVPLSTSTWVWDFSSQACMTSILPTKPSPRPSLCLEAGSLTGIWGSLATQASQSQVFSCLYFPRAGITNSSYQTQLSGQNSGLPCMLQEVSTLPTGPPSQHLRQGIFKFFCLFIQSITYRHTHKHRGSLSFKYIIYLFLRQDFPV